ncbi:MAG: hypothetical protein HRT47_09090 [Candidatus Caenarcaniphilales bacterium]|nr:hypothetical protein [Candidatus Caenarcaniphilales bacterium]
MEINSQTSAEKILKAQKPQKKKAAEELQEQTPIKTNEKTSEITEAQTPYFTKEFLQLHLAKDESQQSRLAISNRINAYFRFAITGAQVMQNIQEQYHENPEITAKEIQANILETFNGKLGRKQIAILNQITETRETQAQDLQTSLVKSLNEAREKTGVVEGKTPSTLYEWQSLFSEADKGEPGTALEFKRQFLQNRDIYSQINVQELISDENINKVQVSLVMNAPSVTYNFLEAIDHDLFTDCNALVPPISSKRKNESNNILAGPETALYPSLVPITSKNYSNELYDSSDEIMKHESGHIAYNNLIEVLNANENSNEMNKKLTKPLNQFNLEELMICSEEICESFEDSLTLFEKHTQTEIIEYMKMNTDLTIFNSSRETADFETEYEDIFTLENIYESFLGPSSDAAIYTNIELIRNIDLRAKLGVNRNELATLTYASPDPFSLLLKLENDYPLEKGSTDDIIDTISHLSYLPTFHSGESILRLLDVLEQRGEEAIESFDDFFLELSEQDQSDFINIMQDLDGELYGEFFYEGINQERKEELYQWVDSLVE